MNRKTLITLGLIIILSTNLFSQNQNVAINATGSLPNASAMLDISSTNKGLLIPRMATTQRDAIGNPATGLIVYDNSLNEFYYYNGTTWTTFSSSGSGATITAFSWDDASNDLIITEDGTPWTVNINNEADDLTDNVINDLSNVNASPIGTGQVLKWDGSQWYAGTDEAGAGGTQITAFTWNDATNLLQITEGGTDWGVTINNEADDLSDNVINELSNVNSAPANGDFLQWDGSQWIAAAASAGSCTSLNDAYNCGGAGAGRTINANAGSVEVTTATEFKAFLVNTSGNGTFGISAEHTNIGVTIAAGSTNASNSYSTIQATTNSSSNSVSAVLGSSTGGAYGVTGEIEASGTGLAGVNGSNLRTSGGHGVYGMGVNGVVGETNRADGYGVYGINNATQASGDGPGVYGIGSVGVFGQTYNGASFGVYGENLDGGTTYNNIGTAGWGWVGVYGQTGSDGFGVYSDGNMGASGTKSFVIDHPLDPDNKTLKHFCAESPEVLNIYRGNIILDNNGEAKIDLPEYFSKININFSYYLTPIGAPAPKLHVKEEVKGNSFIIAGGEENLKVSWVLYAERNDKYIQQNPKSKQVEIEKRQKGKYWSPKAYGKPDSDGIFYRKKSTKQNIELPKNRKQNILE